MVIENGLVFTENFTFEPLTITTLKDEISSLDQANHSPLFDTDRHDVFFDASGCYVLPGLTDIHFHGCNGYDFCTDSMELKDFMEQKTSMKAFEAITAFAFTHGVTSVCPATMTLPAAELSRIFKHAADFSKFQATKQIDSATADLIGIHMEGPFINPRKKGAQNDAYIQSPSSALLRSLQKDANGLIKLVSLAPEIPGAIDCIKECIGEFRFSVAHTEADYSTAAEAFFAGADHITHLYNAMPPFTHRAPGVIGAAFDSPNCFAEIICDGVHVSPSAVRAAFQLFGEDRMILISDSMEATGKPDGCYCLGGLTVQVTGNRATLADGTLAGSVTPLYECLKHAVSIGIPLSSAIRATTINPCRSIGMDDLYGSISTGKKAHFLVLNQKDLSIKAVIKGDTVFTPDTL